MNKHAKPDEVLHSSEGATQEQIRFADIYDKAEKGIATEEEKHWLMQVQRDYWTRHATTSDTLKPIRLRKQYR